MKKFYISLVDSLCGYCLIAYAKDETQVREYAVKHLGRMWCSVYNDSKNMIVIGEPIYL